MTANCDPVVNPKPINKFKPVIINPTPDLILFERDECYATRVDNNRRIYIERGAVESTAPGIHLGRIYGSQQSTVEPLGQLLLRVGIGMLTMFGSPAHLALDITYPSDIPEGLNDFARLALRAVDNAKSLTATFGELVTIELMCGSETLLSVMSNEFRLIPHIERMSRVAAQPLLPPWAQTWSELTRPAVAGSLIWQQLAVYAGGVTKGDKPRVGRGFTRRSK